MEHKPDISNLRTRTHNDNKPSSNLAQRGIFYPVPPPLPRSLDLLNEKTKKKKKIKIQIQKHREKPTYTVVAYKMKSDVTS